MKKIISIITILVLIIILVVLCFANIEKKSKFVKVVIATQIIEPKTRITRDMLKEVKVSENEIDNGIYKSIDDIIDSNLYTDVNTVIPKGGMIYKDSLISEEELTGQNYLLKEVTEKAMYDAVDLAAYEKNGIIKIDSGKFVENFLRGFAESATLTKTYKIEIYDINETPPKVRLRVSTIDSSDQEIMDFTISNIKAPY